jgi:hypothetical protein
MHRLLRLLLALLLLSSLAGCVTLTDPESGQGYVYGAALIWSDLLGLLRQGWLALPLGLALWLPGRVLLSLARLDQEWDWGERTALSVGLSLASLPVLMTWTTLLGLPWSRPLVWIGAAMLVGTGGLTVSLISSLRQRPLRLPSAPSLASLTHAAPALALAIIFLGALFLRLAMVRDLAAPPWVDSVHHALIIRLILEGGVFPPDYTPFLSPGVVNYHSGFHTGAAVFLWLSNLDLAQGLLLYGQVLNALVVFPVYLFTRLYTHSRAAGVTAALIAAFITPMPAYYASWGRYTQLAGLLIFPAALALLKTLPPSLRLQHLIRGRLLLAAVACGGLFLTHYRIAAFLGLLLAAELIIERLAWAAARGREAVLRRERSAPPADSPPIIEDGQASSLAPLESELLSLVRPPSSTSRSPILGWAAAGGVAILLTLPWWPAAWSEMIGPKLHWGTGTAAAFADFNWAYLTAGLGRFSLALAAVGGVWALLLRQRWVLSLALWVGLLFLAANLGALGLPGESFINSTSVAISLFLPLALLGGFGLGWLGQALSSLLAGRFSAAGRTAPWLVLVAGGAAAMFLGAQALLPILRADTFLFRTADRPALAWIEENLPQGSTVLINSFAWGYGVYAGQDGGYWIGPLTGRPTFPPPVLYGMDRDHQVIRATSETARQFQEAASDPTALHALLLEHDIAFVYIGARGGRLDPGALDSSPLFERLYHRPPTWVFRALPLPALSTSEKSSKQP